MAAYGTHKTNTIYILKVGGETDINKWKVLYTIDSFTKPANCFVWSSDNKILALSHDNSCIVLEKDSKSGKWVSHLVVMESQYRSLKCGAWSPDGTKFACAGGNKSVYIGYWDDVMRLWNTEKLKKCKFRST